MTSLSMDTTSSTLHASTRIKPPDVLDPKIVIVIISIAAPIIFFVGMIGNILIIMVIRRGALPSIATSLSFTYLAVVDIIVLVFGLVDLWLYSYKIFIRDFNPTWCAIHLWLIYVGVSLSSWALVFITIQRTISIYFPLKNISIATKSNTLIGLGVMTVLICVLNLHMLWTLGLTEGPLASDVGLENAVVTGNFSISLTTAPSVTTGTRPNMTNTSVQISSLVAPNAAIPYCNPLPEHYTFFYGVWTWIDLAVACLVPTIFLAIGNLLIICRLTTATHKRQEMSQNRDDNNNNKNLSIVLMSITIVFFVCTLPITVFQIGFTEWFDLGNPSGAAAHLLVRVVVNLLQYANNAANFILYCLTSDVFRKKFYELMCRSKRKQKNTSSHASVTGRARAVKTEVTSVTSISKVNMNKNENQSTKGHENTAL